MKNFNLRISIWLFVVGAFLFSCSKNPSEGVSYSFIDDKGVEITFDSLPKRIISLAPNITEALFAIGADSLVVGVTDFCDYPSETKSKTKTGSYLSPDYEAIAFLKPDLIIMNVESTSQPTYQSLKNLGMKIYVSNAKNISDIISMIRNLGELTGKSNSADIVLSHIDSERESFPEKKYSDMPPSLILISASPLITANGKTFIGEVLSQAGIKNIYSEQTLEYPSISYEDVISRNPELIIFPTDTSDIKQSEKYISEIKRQLNSTAAVKNNKIIMIDDDIMFRPGPRVMEGVKLLRNKLSGMN